MFKKGIIICASIMFVFSAAMGIAYNNQKIKTVEINGIMPVVSEKDLMLNSEIVIAGTVTEIKESKWSNPELIEGKRNILQTDVVVKVEEVISGECSKNEVVIRIDKGFDKNKKLLVKSEGYPDFKIGESSILFLSIDDSDIATEEEYYVLTGMKNGKLTENEVRNRFEINSEKNVVKELKEKIIKEKNDNPRWKEEQEKQKEKTIENNKRLFGE